MTVSHRPADLLPVPAVEWVTLGAVLGCYAVWAGALWGGGAVPWLSWGAVTLALAFHSSLAHEALHGHPFRNTRANTALIWPPIGLLVPYARFRDLHLAHHRDANLTDPYDDPESNYLDPEVWTRLPGWLRAVLRLNNTLAGRILIGPAIGQAVFMAGELRLIRAGAPGIAAIWARHLAGVAGILGLVALSPMPVWAYLLAAYAASGLLRIRTFAEHRAHEAARGRTVIIEDRGPLAFLFLFNNLHVVHHMHPGVPWYRLPGLYRQGRARYLSVNDGYVFASYGALFRAHLLRAKDPVPHPLWRRR